MYSSTCVRQLLLLFTLCVHTVVVLIVHTIPVLLFFIYFNIIPVPPYKSAGMICMTVYFWYQMYDMVCYTGTLCLLPGISYSLGVGPRVWDIGFIIYLVYDTNISHDIYLVQSGSRYSCSVKSENAHVAVPKYLVTITTRHSGSTALVYVSGHYSNTW